MDAGTVRDRLTALFVEGGRFQGRFQPPQETELEELVAGAVWQAPIWPTGSATAVLLRVYPLSNGNRILTHFWQNEARALRRLSSRRHPSLPRLRGAGLLPDGSLGYLLLDDPGAALEGEHPRALALSSDRRGALRQFLELCDGLALLHRLGMVHRKVSPHTIVALATEQAPARIDGFQMSALVGSWMRGKGASEPSPKQFLPASPTSLVCLAPEVIAPLFGKPVGRLEGFACDVFGLGMTVIPWFAGPHDTTACRAVSTDDRYDREVHESIVRDAHERLRRADLPGEVVRMLVAMTDPHAGSRVPSAVDALESLSRIYPSVAAQFAAAVGAPEVQPRCVYFMRETAERIYADGATRSAPDGLDEREYASFVQRDLTDAFMTWSPRGFEPWDPSDPDRTAQARVALLGQRYTYFCQYYSQTRADEDQRILVIKYLINAGRTRDLREQTRRGRLPPVEVLFFTPGGRRRPLAAKASSWTDLVHDVSFDANVEEQSTVFKAARWLCAYAEGGISAECFSYTRVLDADAPPSGPVVLCATGPGVESRPDLEGPAFLDLFARVGLTNAMGAFFEQLDEAAREEGDTLEFVLSDAAGVDHPVRLQFDRRLDERTVSFRSVEGAASIPPRGRVRPDDRARRIILSRQRAALRDLERDYELLAQLHEPRGLALARPEDLSVVGAGLEEPTQALMRRILAEEPIFIVQGPPGTGKTFVAAHVIEELFRRDPNVRVLITSQSNAALDNLLRAVRRRRGFTESDREGAGALFLRHSSQEGESRVAEDARDCLLPAIVESVRRAVEQRGDLSGELRAITRRWRSLARERTLDTEIYFATQRAANLVFATCAGAGANVESLRAGSGFDWVVLEEAARAWLHEVAVPLVQGERWLLIGDQRQLPAYKRDEVERVLGRDIQDKVTAEALGFSASEALRPYLGYFGHLMEAIVSPGDWTSPRERIEVQRRMHPEICGLVSHAFYDDRLEAHPTARRSHGLKTASWAANTALKWIDTSAVAVRANERGRENFFEVVKALISQLGVIPEMERGVKPLLVLTPYRDQLKLLGDRVRGVSREVFSSVDAVQGDEAEVVIVSLVRQNTFDAEASALGFLRSPERVNVMFSRARRLLVIVGGLSHFERFANTHWGRVGAYLRSVEKYRIDVAEALPQVIARGGQR